MISQDSDTIVVWFSCGAASAIALQETIRQYGDSYNIRAVNNPVIEEDEDNIRFMRDVSDWLNIEIEQASRSLYPDNSAQSVWEHRKFMSGPQGAPCTLELKKRARQEWELHNKTCWMVLGFTVDEKRRHDQFVKFEREDLLPVLIDAGLTKQDCYDRLLEHGIEPPRMYRLGYPNANCVGCVKATSPTYWNKVRQTHPEVFAARAEQSRKIGAKLVRVSPKQLPFCEQDNEGFWWDMRTGECLTEVTDQGGKKTNGVRIYLDELPSEARGQPLKSMTIECGIFCDAED